MLVSPLVLWMKKLRPECMSAQGHAVAHGGRGLCDQSSSRAHTHEHCVIKNPKRSMSFPLTSLEIFTFVQTGVAA